MESIGLTFNFVRHWFATTTTVTTTKNKDGELVSKVSNGP
jgi:hypothetical protein